MKDREFEAKMDQHSEGNGWNRVRSCGHEWEELRVSLGESRLWLTALADEWVVEVNTGSPIAAGSANGIGDARQKAIEAALQVLDATRQSLLARG